VKQLSGIDASFLYLETATELGHVSGLSVFRKPDIPGWRAYETARDQLQRQLPLLAPLRRRVMEVPFQLDHPFWIDDPDFDLDYHVREAAVPPPGTMAQVAAVVGRIISRPLDRAHPLWEVYVIEGLEGNRFGYLTKIHHAAIDGALGAELMGRLFDAEPDPPRVELDDPFRPEPVPSAADLLWATWAGVLRKPGKLARLEVRSLRALGELTRNEGLTGLAEAVRALPDPRAMLTRRRRPPEQDEPPHLPDGTAPPTPFNAALTPHRRIALRSISLDDVKAVKNGLGATVNDVVLALCAGGLRRYLTEHEALPENPLVAMIPVSIRTGLEDDPWTNRVSGVFVPLPTDEADPGERVALVHETMVRAKERHGMLPAETLLEYSQFAPPALSIRAVRVAHRLRLADRLNPPFNLVVSNVPGPRTSLFLGGAELEHYYPISTIVEGQGLNITVQSYRDVLDIGLVACASLVPDVDRLADLMIGELQPLAKAAGVTRPRAARPHRERAGRARAAARH
jgi:WS/DGAT/MGAT family acyltransferase